MWKRSKAARRARAALERTFPGIPVPVRAPLGDPRPLDGDLDFYLDRVRIHNDEVRVARVFEEGRTSLVLVGVTYAALMIYHGRSFF